MSATGRTGARIFICTRFRVLLLVGFFRRGFNDDGIGDDRRPEKLAVISRERFMFRLGTHVLLAGILACLGAGAVLAQNQTQPQSTKPPATSTIKMEDASKWTKNGGTRRRQSGLKRRRGGRTAKSRRNRRSFQVGKAGSFFMTV